MANLTYSRAVFDVADEAAARRIILTPEFGQDTEERWERETPYLVDLIGRELSPAKDRLLIDYGCGIGRMSKALIERFGCRVLGVDLSERMRALAPDYVRSPLFSVVSPHLLHTMARSGMRADYAISVWVLQHVLQPDVDIGLIAAAMRPGTELFVVNLNGRAVPTVEGRWANDGLDVREILATAYDLKASGELDDAAMPAQTKEVAFWATYARHEPG